MAGAASALDDGELAALVVASPHDRDLPLEPELVAFLRRYRDVIVFMSTFLAEQSRNPRKDTPFDDRELERLLGDAGIPEPPETAQRS